MNEDERYGAAAGAGLGALVVGLAVYMLLANLGGGVDLATRWSFDQEGTLELEGVGILAGLAAMCLAAAPLGSALGVKVAGGRRAWWTALAVVPAVTAVTSLLLWLVPSGPDDPVLAPYLVWSGVPLTAFVVHLAVARERGGRDGG